MKKTRMNQAELAARRGTTRQAMSQLLRRHGIHAGSDGKFDPQDVDRLLEATDKSTETLADAIRRKEFALAKLRELELDVKSGRFVEAAWVGEELVKTATILRSVILRLPNKALSRVADDAVKRSLYASAIEARDECLRQLAGAIGDIPNLTLCQGCSEKVASAADKFQFSDDAFPKEARRQ